MGFLAKTSAAYAVHIDIEDKMLQTPVVVDGMSHSPTDPVYIFKLVLNCKEQPVRCKACCDCGFDSDGYARAICRSGKKECKRMNVPCETELCQCKQVQGKAVELSEEL